MKKEENYPWINRFSETLNLKDHRKNIKAAEALGMTLVMVSWEAGGIYYAHFKQPEDLKIDY